MSRAMGFIIQVFPRAASAGYQVNARACASTARDLSAFTAQSGRYVPPRLFSGPVSHVSTCAVVAGSKGKGSTMPCIHETCRQFDTSKNKHAKEFFKQCGISKKGTLDDKYQSVVDAYKQDKKVGPVMDTMRKVVRDGKVEALARLIASGVPFNGPALELQANALPKTRDPEKIQAYSKIKNILSRATAFYR